MEKTESLKEFYRKLSVTDKTPYIDNAVGHFNVFPRKYCSPAAAYHRRDFYKISLITKGKGIIHFGDKDIPVDRPALFFSNPSVAHSWEAVTDIQEGWFCLFTEDFIFSRGRTVGMLLKSHVGGEPVVFLNDDALTEATFVFRRMEKEILSDYIYKYDELYNYLQLLIHLAVKYHPSRTGESGLLDAPHRITFRFLDLLENQFPIENTDTPLRNRYVRDYADRLSVHENHLNHVVKTVTGKNPSGHIAYRITQEAKALLKNTDWSISDIAYGLSFEYPSHFTNFFKKNAGMSPREFREKLNL